MEVHACFASVIPALAELEVAYKEAMADPAFQVRHGNAKYVMRETDFVLA
jgi:hypothetical protein